jgi:ligand-binding sensor domain-containing protein
MYRLVLSLVLVGIFSAAHSQTGNYFLSHYTPPDKKLDPICYAMVQDARGIMYFANRSGVLEFDGKSWRLAATAFPIYTLTTTKDGHIFAGGLSGFGRIDFSKGEFSFVDLAGTDAEAKGIIASAANDHFVYWLTEANIFSYERAIQKVQKLIVPDKENSFKKLFMMGDKVYVTTENGTLYSLKENALKASQFNADFGDLVFTHSVNKKTLVGTSLSAVYVVSGDQIQPVPVKEQDFLQANGLVGGTWVTDELIALGTLRGGVIFVNINSGETQEITNYYTGLPDNEVFAIYGDGQQGVWVAHEYGVTRISPTLPFRTFTHYPGLRGNVLSAYSHRGQLYVGTSLGLFKLIKDLQYEDQVYYVTSSKRIATSPEPAPSASVPASETKPSQKKGIFSKKKKAATSEAAPTTKEPRSTEAVYQELTTKEKKTRRVLKSLQYAFAKVNGVEGKVTHLAESSGQLVAGGLGGLYLISDLTARTISAAPISTLYQSKTLNQLFIGTYDERMECYDLAKGTAKSVPLPDSVRDHFTHIFEDRLENVWFCGRKGIVKLEYLENELSNVDEIFFDNPTDDETVGLAVGTDVYIVSGGKFYQYNSAKNVFSPYDSLPDTRKCLASAGLFWFNDGQQWRTIDGLLSKKLKMDWLDLFADLRFLSLDDSGNGMWVIASNNELYHFTPAQSKTVTPHPLSFKLAQGEDVKVSGGKKLEVKESGFLSFQFIQPEYWGTSTTQYRYWLKGLTKQWSPWTYDNAVPIPYLPSGNYSVEVESRDLFGEVRHLETIQVRVLPPYWKTPWFYALELSAFLMLVLFSVWLSVGNPKYRPVSQVLSMLTIILFIQLVQTTVYSVINLRSSPVIEFFIQVAIALLVLPLEQRLRRFMEMATAGKYQISKLFMPPKRIVE